MPKFLTLLKKRSQSAWKKFTTFIDNRPFGSFFILLGLLLVLIIVGSVLRKPKATEETKTPEPKLVETYTFGESPKMTFSATVEKSGVISIFAQSPGIVQKVNLTEGQKVGRGGTIVSLSTNYQGGNAASLSRQLAQKSFDNTAQTFDLQKDIIGKQRDLAEKGNIQAEQMREITRQSLGDTRSLISLNEDIISGVDEQIAFLESTNAGGVNDSAILAAKQGKAAAGGGLAQLKSTLKTLEFQSDEEKTPAQIGDISKDLTLRQLDLQERGLVLSKDIAELNLKLARVSEGMMFPAAPCSGMVERVYVKVGQNISPGTLIATIKADQGENTAVVLVPRDIARQVSKGETSDFLIGGNKVSLYPRYVSSEATDGNLYSVLYAIPSVFASQVTNASSLQVSIPMGSKTIATSTLFVPLDSVYQTQDTSYVYVMNKEGDSKTIKTVEVSLGEASGSYVKVLSGLSPTDTVILSRDIQEGDTIRTE